MYGRVVALCSSFQRERKSCHIWLGGRINVASPEANLGGGQGIIAYPVFLFSHPLSGRSPDISEILLTRTLCLNSIDEFSQLIQFIYDMGRNEIFISLEIFVCSI